MPRKTFIPEQQTLYGSRDSLDQAIDHSLSQLPITDSNQLMSLFMEYHNTLLEAIQEAHHSQSTGVVQYAPQKTYQR